MRTPDLFPLNLSALSPSKSLFIINVPKDGDLVCFYSHCPSKVPRIVAEETSNYTGCLPCERCYIRLSELPNDAS